MVIVRNPARDGRGAAGPRPARLAVAVDTAVLTVVGHELHVLEVRRPSSRGWSLPGAFLHEGERLLEAVGRSLRDQAGLEGEQPRHLLVSDEPERDGERGVL